MHDRTRAIVHYWLPPIIWMGVIFYFSSDRFSSEETGSVFESLVIRIYPGIDRALLATLHHLTRKLGHLTEYAFLAILWVRAFRSTSLFEEGGKSAERRAALSTISILLLVAACALADEWRQSLTLHRTGSLIDCLIDLVGGGIGMTLFAFLMRLRKVECPESSGG